MNLEYLGPWKGLRPAYDAVGMRDEGFGQIVL